MPGTTSIGRARVTRSLVVIAAALVLATSLSVATAMSAPTPASAATFYCLDQTDSWRFSTASREVTVNGGIKWYGGYVFPYKNCTIAVWNGITRGEPYGRVTLNRTGCLFVRLTYSYLGGSVGFPPSGSISGASSTGSYFRKCGAAGTYASISGLGLAKRAMAKATLCIQYGRYSSSTPVNRACDANYVP